LGRIVGLPAPFRYLEAQQGAAQGRLRPDIVDGFGLGQGHSFFGPLFGPLGPIQIDLPGTFGRFTDQRGLYSADPRQDRQARFIAEATAGDPALEAMAGGAGSGIARGGMITKVRAAQRAARSGAHTLIASGREADVLPRLARGEALGTLLHAGATPLAARKQWLADHLQLAGSLVLDAGAAQALAAGRSLLPVGVTAVEGEFERGAAVACRTADGREVARGLVNYSSSEARRIARRPSAEIEAILGYLDAPELIHRDNLVLL